MCGGGIVPPPKSRPRTPTSRRRSSFTGRCGTRVMNRPVCDETIIPMIFALDGVVHERIRCRHGEDVPDAGVVVDVEGLGGRTLQHVVLAAAAREIVVPRLARVQDTHPTIRVDPQDRYIGVLLGAKVDPRRLPARG